MAFEPLSGRTRRECPFSDELLLTAPSVGLLPLELNGQTTIVAAPRLIDTRQLVAMAAEGSGLGERLRLTTVARLHEFVARCGASAIERRAVHGLRSARPDLSAAEAQPRKGVLLALTAFAGAAALPVLFAPSLAVTAIEIALATVFLAWTALRVFGLVAERFVHRKRRPVSNRSLPVYTVVVALYRETKTIRNLIASLGALNYPALCSKCRKPFQHFCKCTNGIF
jgi:hypothetical protein